MNVYVADELKARLEKANLNLSSFAQEAWEAALARAELPEGEFSLDVLDDDGDAVELQFTGSHILTSGYNGTELYLTGEDKLVIVDEEGTYEVRPVTEVGYEFLWNVLRDDDETTTACSALGIKRVVHL